MKITDKILLEIKNVFEGIEDQDLAQFINYLNLRQAVFLFGEGRSGFQARSFAMRLMHLQYQTYLIGETITPAMNQNDVLIAISGSGETNNVINLVEKAQKIGVVIIAITSSKKNSLAHLADHVLVLPGASKIENNVNSIQLLGTLFEQSVLIATDAISLMIAEVKKLKNIDLMKMHSNIE